MSLQDIFQNFKERFGRPIRKRRKLGDDEDDWCDALNDLNLCSSSSDEYVDALEEQIPINSSPKGKKRKKKRKSHKKNKKPNSSNVFGNPPPSVSKDDTTSGESEITHEIYPSQPQEEKLASNLDSTGTKRTKAQIKKQKIGDMNWIPAQPIGEKHRPQTSSTRGHGNVLGKRAGRGDSAKGSTGRSKSSGYLFDPKDFSDSSLPTTEKKGLTIFGARPKTASSSSPVEGEDEPMRTHVGSEQEQSSIDEKSQQQHKPVKSHTGGLTEANLVEVALAIGDNVGKIRHLGSNLNFSSTDISTYCPRGIPVDSSRTLRMLRYWKHKTSEAQQMPRLLEALKSADLSNVVDKFQPEKGNRFGRQGLSDPSYASPKNTDQFVSIASSKAGSSSSSAANDAMKTHDGATSIDKLSLHHHKGRISDRKLEQLAGGLHRYVGDYGNVRSLGEKLGFNRTEVYSYCGYERPKDNSGILRMLRAWRHKTPDAQQNISDLLEALKEAKLQYLADWFHSQEGGKILIPLKRKVTVTLMTSSQFFTIVGLKKKLETLKRLQPDLIDEVRVLQLPYSRIQCYEFTEHVDIMILCHSIENRRFAITNVTDSLYDEFLDYCNKTLGKKKIVVVAHDFPREAKEVREVKMDSFKHTQWTTFEKAGLVMICGMMEKTPEMRQEDWDSLVKFLEAASKSTPVKDDISPPQYGEKGNHDSELKPSKWEESEHEISNKTNSKPWDMSSSGPGWGRTRSGRKPIIYLCTSWGFHSVRGLEEMLQTLLKRSYPGYEVREKELPYSRLQDFRFPSEVGKSDAMILCHSVQNRGFSVTDVHNSIYDEYLKHCNQVFGKDHVAVIVHDFEYSEGILRIHMDTFRRAQPKTFQLAGFVALARKLDVKDVQLSQEDSIKLQMFVKKLI